MCITGYEVCEENPKYIDGEFGRHVCYALFKLGDDGNLTITHMRQSCFDDEYILCNTECALGQHVIPSIYDCCCTGHLCNDVEFNTTGN